MTRRDWTLFAIAACFGADLKGLALAAMNDSTHGIAVYAAGLVVTAAVFAWWRCSQGAAP